MNYKLTLKDYEKYPFLDSFAQEASKLQLMQLPLHRLVETPDGKKALELARIRLLLALNEKNENVEYDKDVKIKVTSIFPSILSYGMSRMIVSCTNQFMINKYANSETEKAVRYLSSELPHVKLAVEQELGFDKNSRRIKLQEYIPLHLIKHGTEYKLVNCKIHNGYVSFTENMDTMHILREKIRSKIMRKMPLNVNPDVKEIFAPIISEITQKSEDMSNTNFGAVEVDDFPPCIKNLITMLERRENLTHYGRFTLTSFYNKIGAEVIDVVSLFQTVKDFQPTTTLYQVEHIFGKGGVKYVPPSCESLKTNNLCRCKDDPLCNRIKHPVGYYSAMKRKKKKQKPLNPS